MTYSIVTFGCAANIADGERLAGMYTSRGYTASDIDCADIVTIVTCMIRQSAEDRAYALIRKLTKAKEKGRKVKIVVTGCLTGMAVHDATGKALKKLHTRYPGVDEFLPIDEVGFEHPSIRTYATHALVPISNGCNNFCTYCVVPYARGKERSRPFDQIVEECRELVQKGFTEITLVGQNVNSYGSDVVVSRSKTDGVYTIMGKRIRPVYVKHLGKNRIPTLFPYLLEAVATLPGLVSVDFISSNPWDFSDELITVIAKYLTISRVLHLPVQSGDAGILKKMNRWYTPLQYERLVAKIRKSVPEIVFSTDIIVGFPGETKRAFENTLHLCQTIGFAKAYVAMYSVRPGTVAAKTMNDSIPYEEKKRRWTVLDDMINKKNLARGLYPKTKK